jgi:hypothetical protein
MKLDTQTVLPLLMQLLKNHSFTKPRDAIQHAINVADELERQVAAHNREQEPVVQTYKLAEPSFNGCELISAERYRQIHKEGYTTEHDDEHDGSEMLAAAICYAHCAGNFKQGSPRQWPWSEQDWKPSGDKIRDLTKSGALIAAEIDRLIRIEWKQPHLNPPTKCCP